MIYININLNKKEYKVYTDSCRYEYNTVNTDIKLKRYKLIFVHFITYITLYIIRGFVVFLLTTLYLSIPKLYSKYSF